MGDKMAPEFLEVPGAGAEPGIDAIPGFSQQEVAVHAVIMLAMPNHWLNRRAAVKEFAQL